MTATSRRIMYVWDSDYPWDVRTEKICRTLVEAGHDVHIVARNKSWAPTLERMPEGTIHRMRPWRGLGQGADNVLGFPAFFSPRWYRLISQTAQRNEIDLIIARDLPLCPTAIAVGRRRRIPVILDMAENYPAMIRDTWAAGKHKLIDYVVRNPRAVDAIERFCLARVDRVLTVVEESSERIIRMGVEPERTTVVSNTPSIDRVNAMQRARSRIDSLEIVYLGLLEVHRGIGDLITAASELARRRVEFRVRIIGDGRHADEFRRQARTQGLSSSQVEFLGRLPYREALRIVAESNVGVIPHHATEAWNSTIPNKLFDYMSLGLAVVSSDARPAARVINATGAGAVYRSGDATDFADALMRMLNREIRDQAGEAGLRAIVQSFNWQMDSNRLLESITES